MKQEQSQVAIELHMWIEDNGQVEETTTKATGYLYNRNKMDVLTYHEQLENSGDTIKNLLTIQREKVSIKRSGAVAMHQQFSPGETSETLFQHMHGAIHMETYTEEIVYQPPRRTKPGELSVAYQVKLNGQDARRHQLTLTIQKAV
ncbi:DUF1934 domain-containing protein [Lentibacillus sp. L22]|uniref:DUF1934 domain-containing protein n=1 Tax=Lentibacillus TaxID=175304 RepID=UPI0022B151E0|nr:DUF1934 domain-containing protein [Lentibacillus daqui]